MPSRYYAFAIAIAAFVGSLVLEFVFRAHWVTWPLISISGFLAAVGIVDVMQTKQAIRRNYPILSHFRFFFEYIRPEIRQYFIESDTESSPFRAPRAHWCISGRRSRTNVRSAPAGCVRTRL